MASPCFVEHLQHVFISLRQQETPLFHPVIFPAVKREFSLCAKRNFLLCCDRPQALVEAPLASTAQF
jgi:hypothetical protein